MCRTADVISCLIKRVCMFCANSLLSQLVSHFNGSARQNGILEIDGQRPQPFATHAHLNKYMLFAIALNHVCIKTKLKPPTQGENTRRMNQLPQKECSEMIDLHCIRKLYRTVFLGHSVNSARDCDCVVNSLVVPYPPISIEWVYVVFQHSLQHNIRDWCNIPYRSRYGGFVCLRVFETCDSGRDSVKIAPVNIVVTRMRLCAPSTSSRGASPRANTYVHICEFEQFRMKKKTSTNDQKIDQLCTETIV